jgi:hypothetical protein
MPLVSRWLMVIDGSIGSSNSFSDEFLMIPTLCKTGVSSEASIRQS